jgi:hypothetical protein
LDGPGVIGEVLGVLFDREAAEGVEGLDVLVAVGKIVLAVVILSGICDRGWENAHRVEPVL